MALTKAITNDKIKVINHGDWSSVQVRTATIISENGEEISHAFYSHVVMPNADLTQEDADVADIAAAVFTTEVQAAYTAHLASQDVS